MNCNYNYLGPLRQKKEVLKYLESRYVATETGPQKILFKIIKKKHNLNPGIPRIKTKLNKTCFFLLKKSGRIDFGLGRTM